jgi:multiple sugar transport system permease protein
MTTAGPPLHTPIPQATPPRTGRERLESYLLAAPSAAMLFGVALFPIAATAWLSFYRMIIVFHQRHFLGLGNYAFLLRDQRFWTALGNTSYFALVSVFLEVTLGLGLALLLDARVPGRAVLLTAVLVPWAIPSAIASKIWAWIWNPEYGVLTHILPGGTSINWLGTPGYAMHAAIVVDVWKTTPFVALLLLAALQGIPEDLYRAAAIDGASPLRVLRRITLPLLKPALAVAVVLRMLDAFRVFDSVYVLTGGGPANTTETLSIYTYKTLMSSGDFGYGSTLAVATFLCVLAVSMLYIKLIGAEARQ